MDAKQISELVIDYGTTYGIGLLVAYMVFIIYKLARESRAGKAGTIWLFLVLGLGIFGFMSKSLIQLALGG